MFDHTTKYRAIVHYTHFFKSLRQVAKLYNVSKSCLHKWIHQNGGKVRKQRIKKDICSDISKFIENTLSNNPFTTMETLTNKLQTECNIKRSSRSILRYTNVLIGLLKPLADMLITFIVIGM